MASSKDHWSNGAKESVFIGKLPGFCLCVPLCFFLYPGWKMAIFCISFLILTFYIYGIKKSTFAATWRAAKLFITGRSKSTNGKME